MATPTLGVMVPDSIDATDATFAAHAESAGYDSVWIGENWGTNAFVRLTTVMQATTDIAIGTAITNVYSRSPATIAMTGATLERLSGGRFRLGVGPSSPTLIEGLHGLQFDRPVRRTHETVEVIRALTDGRDEPVDYSGELFELSGFPPLDRSFPIYNAAMGPANRRVTGRLCDGWIPHLVPFSVLEEAFETVTRAAEERDRDPDDITVSPYLPVAVSDDETDAKRLLAGHVAFYVGSSDGFKRGVATCFPAEAETVAGHWQDGNQNAAVDAVTDEMLDELTVYGTPETARARLGELLSSSVVDDPMLAVPDRADDELALRTVEALAPSTFE